MVFEIAEIVVKAGAEAQFEDAVRKAVPLFRAAQGATSLELQKVVEHPTTYRLVVGWNTVEDHMVTFRNSEAFKQWRELVGPHFAEPPRVVHVARVLAGF